MSNYRVRRSRRRPNMAVPVLILLVAAAGLGIGLASCRSAAGKDGASQSEALSGSVSESAPESAAEESGADEGSSDQQSSQSQSREESAASSAAPQASSSSSASASSAKTAAAAQNDGKEIPVPQTDAWKPFYKLFPAGTDDFRLVLVNKDYVMPSEFPDLPLKTVTGSYRVHEGMYDALMSMMKDAKAAGVPLAIASGYRPLARSKVLYENKVQEYVKAGYSASDAAAEAAKWIAPPGTSEHATGLSADLISADYYTKYSDLVQEFESDPAAKWMKAHCAEYGFILRFPKNKEDITKVVYEPWHFRYVGVKAAAEIMSRGITLEEYLGVA